LRKIICVVTLALGSQPRQGLAKVQANCEGRESHSCFRKCGRVWENEPPHSQVSFWWITKFLKSDCRGQNPLDYGVYYIIEKILERRCLKWARMTHLDTSNTNYGQKKGRESNWQFDSWPLKVENCLDFFVCRWLATYHCKALNEGYNFYLNIISIGGLSTKLWASKVTGVPTLGIWDSHLGVPKQNDIWVLVPWPGTKHTIRGKVVASFKFGLWWVLWIHVCPWHVCAPKMLQLCTNQLVVWFVQV